MMVATTLLMVVCGVVMWRARPHGLSRMVSNRTDMHNAVRNATGC
jgi:hypothetical protein